MVDIETLHGIDMLQTTYVRALDQRDLPAWVACFSTEAEYSCIPFENVEQGLPLALMLDDNHARIRDRAKFIDEVWRGTFEDYRTRHFVQRLSCETEEDERWTVQSNVMVLYTTAEGRSEILVAGTYVDEIERRNDTYTFRKKVVLIDTATTPRYLVYPI